MILVQNHLQQLNGNRLIILVLLLLFASCSPKVRPVITDSQPKQESTEEIAVSKDINRNGPAKVALLLPFKAKTANLSTPSGLENASMAIEFYQGFITAVNLTAEKGRNFEINVIDSESSSANMALLLKNTAVKEADLIVGPVFPENIKNVELGNKHFISPLAATDPDEFKNKHLISLVPNIKLHADKITKYVNKAYTAANLQIVLLHGTASDQNFGLRLRNNLNSASGKHEFVEYTSINEFEKKIQKDKRYVVLVSSFDKNVVNQTIDKLVALKKRYSLALDVFGHPNWLKQTYTVEKLQALNVALTSSYYVNYKDTHVIDFVKKYRETYNFEPTEFTFKGYDTGLYFSKLLAEHGSNYYKYLEDNKYQGLQNQFNFEVDPQLGYMNTETVILRYKNFQLLPVE